MRATVPSISAICRTPLFKITASFMSVFLGFSDNAANRDDLAT
jgi:hypothetical protein